MTERERVYIAIKHKEPDKVPKGEAQIHYAVADELVGTHTAQKSDMDDLLRWMIEPMSEEVFQSQYKARQFLKIDITDCFPRGRVTLLGKNPKGYTVIEDTWGNKILTTKATSRTAEFAIPDAQSIPSYKFPAVDDFSFDNLGRWVNDTDLFVTCQVWNGYDGVWRALTGVENYLLFTYAHKEELKSLIKEFTEFQVEIAKGAVRHGANAILIADDFAHNTGTFLSPSFMEKFIFPYLEKEVMEIKKLGVPVFFHSCGNINQILDTIVNIGVDGLMGLQPSAHMDLAYIKQKYGGKLCLWGNIDVGGVLHSGALKEVETLVRERIRIGAPGGGYILSTANVLDNSIPLENVLAMYRAAEKYGKYPIHM